MYNCATEVPGKCYQYQVKCQQKLKAGKKGQIRQLYKSCTGGGMEQKIQGDGARESTLKENSLPEMYSYTILAFPADKRLHCIPLMYQRMKNPPMECKSDKFE